MAHTIDALIIEIADQYANSTDEYFKYKEMLWKMVDELHIIDSNSEEPKKQPKFKVGDTIIGPCNNIFQVKKVLDKQYLLHSENGDELNSIEIVDKYSCISEEPASEDLEEEINRVDDWYPVELKYIQEIAHHFAEWQKDQMMKDAVECTWGTEATSSFMSDFPNIECGDKVKVIIVKED